jgi:hypothetical protein
MPVHLIGLSIGKKGVNVQVVEGNPAVHSVSIKYVHKRHFVLFCFVLLCCCLLLFYYP